MRSKHLVRPDRLKRFKAMTDREVVRLQSHINSKFVFRRDGNGIGVRPLYRFLTQIEREMSARNLYIS